MIYRILLPTLFICLFAFPSHSQFEIRVGGGINSSTYTSDFRDAEFQRGLGYQLGADVLVGNRWYFQTGLLFEFLNNPVNDIDINTEVEDIRVNRLRVPALIGHRLFDEESALNIRLFGGANASLVINRSIDESLNFEEDEMTELVYGLNLGGGIDLAFLYLDVGYMFGLNDVFKNAEDSPNNNLFFANAGIRF